MNGYLVMFRQSIDDLPLLLTSDRKAAFDFAAKVVDEDGANECKILNIDPSCPCNVSVYEFRDGRLKGFEVVKGLT